jgi:chorismate mutase / prephenate dehydratase
MSLEELRQSIDATDREIVRLVAERIAISRKIGQEKKQISKQVRDPERERRVFDQVKELAKASGVNERDIEAIYRQIIAASSGVQGVVVAFQGEIGAYSEEAAFRYFGNSIAVKPCEKLDDVFAAVDRGEVTAGIVPIENSLEGSISRTYDLLLESDLRVSGETELRVVHCLIANPGATLASIRTVYSHPQALGQCGAFLRHIGKDLVPTYDTAGSVKMIKERGIIDGAAIASSRAAEIYSMNVIAREIEDNPHNFTRFFALGKEDSPRTGNDKTSIVFSVKHRPGALYELLKELATRKVNLTKIESRPTRQKPWEYNFYLDFEGHREDAGATEALQSLDQYAIFVKVLGSYPKAQSG